jgi:hypothetical protein
MNLGVASRTERPMAWTRAALAIIALGGWLIAAFARINSDPLSVAACVAALNTLCLFPRWSWAPRRMERGPSLLLLAAVGHDNRRGDCERWTPWPIGLKHEWQLELRDASASK